MTTKKITLINRMMRNVFWFSYFGIIFSHLTYNTHSFFSADSPVPLFHTIIFYFFPLHLIKYLIDLCQTILSVGHLIPLALYIFKQHSSNKRLWRILFTLRLLFDIIGHSFAKIQLKSLHHENTTYFWISIVSIMILYLPLYYANFKYAFILKTQE